MIIERKKKQDEPIIIINIQLTKTEYQKIISIYENINNFKLSILRDL